MKYCTRENYHCQNILDILIKTEKNKIRKKSWPEEPHNIITL